MSGTTPLLSVRDLSVRFATRRGTAEAVNGISYDLHAGETLAVVGESGSGKTVSALSLVGLVPQPPGRVSGEVRLDGRDLLSAPPEQLRRVRGSDIGVVFQDPQSSLNPVLTIGRQVTEGMEAHLGLSPDEARERAVRLLDEIGIARPRDRLDSYPHQLSGGMRQRVMIAIGLACRPRVLIADEPTTALDVTIQAQIVELVRRLQEELGMAVIWISHDLGLVAGLADRVLVLYAGRVVEEGGVDELYDRPLHPYTQALMRSLPQLGGGGGELASIPGQPPDPTALPPGCTFWPRCPHRLDPRCEDRRPPLREARPGRRVACFYEAPADTRADR